MANGDLYSLIWAALVDGINSTSAKVNLGELSASNAIARAFQLFRDQKRAPICNGDGGESERLYGLSPGHVLTKQDVADIQNHISDYNDEIGNTVEIINAAYQSAVQDMAPDKLGLLNKIAALETEVNVQRAMRKFDEACERSAVGDRPANPDSTV